MAEPLVEVRAVARTYRVGDEIVVAVEHADCTVPVGARIALEGRSGSGKSTLLQMLGGIETPSRGTIAWPALGRRDELRPRQVAFVFQRESLVEALTVVENVELPLLLAGIAAADARRYALEALDRFELRGLADKLPEELSGGQSQRAAFARAVAQRPRLILADEPTGQLDTTTADHFLALALPLLAADDTALVIATHDARLAARMPTRWRMERGRLETAP